MSAVQNPKNNFLRIDIPPPVLIFDRSSIEPNNPHSPAVRLIKIDSFEK
jgi:hypothetical protein